MKAKILIAVVIATLAITCSKDSYTTKPQISFKSISSTTVTQGNILTFTIDFTDAEGDIQDTMWIQRVSKICPNSPGVQFSTKYKIPDFAPTKNLKGVFEINFAYNLTNAGYPSITGCGTKNDTSYFKFWIRDKALHISDTITSPDIAFLK